VAVAVANVNDPAGKEGPLLVAVVDDHSIITRGLASLLADAAIEVEEYTEIEDLDEPETFDAILLDLHLHSRLGYSRARLQGTAAVQALAKQGARIVIISGGAEQIDLCDSIGLGALSYVPKERVDLVIPVVRTAGAGGRFLTGPLAGALHADVIKRPLGQKGLDDLSRGDVDFLEDAFCFDGQYAAAKRRNWHVGDNLHDVLLRIWRAAAARTASYHLHLTSREVQLVMAWPHFSRRDDLIAYLKVEPNTFQKHLTNIKNKYIQAYPSASNLNPSEIVGLLARRAL
jgi:CheY-like chemotaxis protein